MFAPSRAQPERVSTASVRATFAVTALAVTAAFGCSAAYTLHEIDESDRSLPALVQRDVTASMHLTLLRADLQHIEELLSESTEGHPWEPGSMRRLLGTVDHERAVALVTYADDMRARLPGVALDALSQVRAGVDAIRAQLDAGNVGGARETLRISLRPSFHDADAALALLLRDQMDTLGKTATERTQARDRALHVALGLDALCVVVACVCGAIALLAIRREHARLRAQLEELEMFADRVAHDIRGPLMPVAFALQEAGRGALEPVATFVRRAARSVRVIEGIVEGLYDFARSELAPRPRAQADVRCVVEDVIAESTWEAEQAEVQLSILSIEDALVGCEPGVLSSIVSNLVHNAIRHMDRSPARRVSVSAHRHDRLETIVVQDTGPGLPPGFEARAFLPYTRPDGTRRQGLGLGLATVKRLASAHGGGVSVTSSANGCTFFVELPVSEQDLGSRATSGAGA